MHLTVDIGTKNVLIIGCPASGKTFLSNQLAHDNPKHHVIHTDDYMEYGYKASLYEILDYMSKLRCPTIIEGVIGYRLLRKGVELDCYYPDIVIELEISEGRMHKTYATQRLDKDFDAVRGFVRSHEKILNDYRVMVNPHPPEWHKIKNNY